MTSQWARWCLNHQPHEWLLNRSFRRRSKKTSKLRIITGLCAGNSPVTGEFPAQMASNAEMFPFDDDVIMNNYKRMGIRPVNDRRCSKNIYRVSHLFTSVIMNMLLNTQLRGHDLTRLTFMWRLLYLSLLSLLSASWNADWASTWNVCSNWGLQFIGHCIMQVICIAQFLLNSSVLIRVSPGMHNKISWGRASALISIEHLWYSRGFKHVATKCRTLHGHFTSICLNGRLCSLNDFGLVSHIWVLNSSTVSPSNAYTLCKSLHFSIASGR